MTQSLLLTAASSSSVCVLLVYSVSFLLSCGLMCGSKLTFHKCIPTCIHWSLLYVHSLLSVHIYFASPLIAGPGVPKPSVPLTRGPPLPELGGQVCHTL